MPWIKIDSSMVDHPKIEPLSDAAFRAVLRGLSYANRFMTNGRLPQAFLEKVSVAVLAELTTPAPGQHHAVWDQARDGTIRIHDFHKYQPSKAAVERAVKLNKDRQQKHRDRNGVTLPSRDGAVTLPDRSDRPTDRKDQIPPKPPRRRTPRPSAAKLEQADRQQAELDGYLLEARQAADAKKDRA